MTIKNLAAAAFAAAALITVPASFGTAFTSTPANSITAEAAYGDIVAQGCDVSSLQENYIVADGLVYYMDHSKHEAALAGRWTNTTAVNMPDVIDYHGVRYEITSVRPNAFKRNTSNADRYYIRSFRAGRYVKVIGERAFENCYLRTVSLSSGIESIGDRAFYNTSITEVFIPADCKNIGSEAFANCSLETVFFDAYAKEHYYGTENFKIANLAFAYNEKLRSVTNYRYDIATGDIASSAFKRKTAYIHDDFDDNTFYVHGWNRAPFEAVIFN